MSAENKKAAVIGMGAITPLGPDLKTGWNNLINGVNGVGPKEFPDYPQMDVHLAGAVHGFDESVLVAQNVVTKSEARYLSRALQFSAGSAFAAMQDAGLLVPHTRMQGRIPIKSWKLREDINPEDVLVIGATGVGGTIQTSLEVDEKLKSHRETGQEPKKADLPDIFRGLPARVATVPSLAFGTRGGAFMVGAECASGNYAQGVALERIRSGRSKIVIVVGAESSNIPVAINMFQAIGAQSTQRDKEKAPRAFEDPQSENYYESSGFIQSEGGGSIAYAEPSYARTKGLEAKAFLVGYGDSTDAHHPSFPLEDGSQQLRAMQLAIADAGDLPDYEEYINAHATGTAADSIEADVIRRLNRQRLVGISSTKPSHGHLLGATSIVEAIWTIMAMREQILPPNIKSVYPSEVAKKLGLVANEARRTRNVGIGINNGFGFGGVNATLVFVAA